MKKLFILFIVALIFTVVAGCGTPKKCELCDEEYTGKSYTVTIFEEEYKVCQICHDDYMQLFE